MTGARHLLKRALSVPTRLFRGLRRVPVRWILNFHEIGLSPWATSPPRFEAHLATLLGAASVVPLATLLTADDEALRVALTFDDGYAGVARSAVPSLERAGVSATVFLPTDLVPAEDGLPRQDRGLYPGVEMMGWSTIRRLSACSPLCFESHGAGHEALPSLGAETRRADLLRSRAALGAATGHSPRFLAYPFGIADAESTGTAREVGFEAAFTTRHAGVRPGSDPFRIPRVDVRGDYSPKDILSILRGDWDFLTIAQRLRGERG